MTIAQLIKLLNQFDPHLPIHVINHGYQFTARAFYSTLRNEESIIIHSDDLESKFDQVTELKL